MTAAAPHAAATHATLAIDLQGVRFAYGDFVVLDHVDVHVHAHEFICIVGPNGGGKTTLLKLILGLLPAQRGTIRVFGLAPEQARPRIGYMAQASHLDPQFPVTVMDVVLMGRLRGGTWLAHYGKRDAAVAADALNEVGLFEVRGRPFSALSGGQRQRVLIARALAAEPELLMLDEPTANLDLLIQDDFYELLQRLKGRLTVVLVSHDVSFVARQVQRVICVNRKVISHPTAELTGEMMNEIYGGNVSLVRHDVHTHGPCEQCE
ncbi:High-affinity zinc uptake system ATP-binding protein ZnuC [Phycisphaerae bacterium RAS1]|nr:High-affinity zinc uptake system ATP-binding protein ZnuC [Phycisphaerae bacterium RAS1]